MPLKSNQVLVYWWQCENANCNSLSREFSEAEFRAQGHAAWFLCNSWKQVSWRITPLHEPVEFILCDKCSSGGKVDVVLSLQELPVKIEKTL